MASTVGNVFRNAFRSRRPLSWLITAVTITNPGNTSDKHERNARKSNQFDRNAEESGRSSGTSTPSSSYSSWSEYSDSAGPSTPSTTVAPDVVVARPIVPPDELYLAQCAAASEPLVIPHAEVKPSPTLSNKPRLSLAPISPSPDADIAKDLDSPYRIHFQPLSPPPAHAKRRKSRPMYREESSASSFDRESDESAAECRVEF
ncbi:hypothetical protein BD410DRAFT_334038 [Rickenella mellea]|uniref:Uncharacterized protein n=1 Tax=Rickenella mellea TaxID=50990 RepID=A0A4Y7QJM1_9AGAM|nr:hypothetical protein BD410DRAFT_334038 [Rickenella mellea]